MKATIELIAGRFHCIGLHDLHETSADGKPVYERTYLYTFGGKTYATMANAQKALARHGFEYLPAEQIVSVCAYD